MERGQEVITIYKYSYDVVMDEIPIAVPEGAELLDVQNQDERLTFWFMVDTTAPLTSHTYLVYGTGHPVGIWTGKHVGTVQQHNGALVWHIFEKVTR
jgi:hypothetical protein